jgi:hypothetical protein
MELHYDIMHDHDGNIEKICCNHCDYFVGAWEVKPTDRGHRWPRMGHIIKRHLRDIHGINLYKRKP